MDAELLRFQAAVKFTSNLLYISGHYTSYYLSVAFLCAHFHLICFF